MINIKSFVKHRNSTATVTTNSQSGSSSSSGTTTPTNDWFYYSDDANAVVCRYDLHSVGNIVAFSYGGGDGGSSSGSGGSNVVVVDNLTSYNTAYALSANMGRNLKQLLDNVQTQGGGGTASSIDWQNIQNVPSTFPPTSHTHAISDVNGLQTQLTNLGNNISTLSSNIAAHANDNNIHLTATEKNVIDNLTLEQIQFIVALMNITTIQNGTIRFNANVNATGNVVALT